MFLVKQSTGQCYEVPEITAQASESELWQLEVDIQGLTDHILQTVGEIAAVTPVCNGFELESEIINLCISTLEICLQTDSLVSTADLDVLPSLLKMDSDAILVTDFVQNEGSCIYQILKQPVFETSPTCAEVLKIFENDLGLSNQFHLNGTSRLAGSREGLISMNDMDSLKTKVYCAQSSPLTGLLLQHHQHIQYLQKLFQKIKSLISLFGGDYINNKINDIHACIKQSDIWEAVFHSGPELYSCLQKIIGSKHKRSTIMEYVLGSGQAVDSLSNQVRDMASTINSNLKMTHQNEMILAAKENALNVKLGGVSTQLKANNKKFRAIFWKLRIKQDTDAINEFTFFEHFTHVAEIDQADFMITNILELSVNILTQTASKKCFTLESFICLDFKSSSISTESPHGTINFNIQTTHLKPLNSYFISCLPDMGQMVVSKLHNTHMVRHLGNDLIGQAGIISLENLKLPGAVNQETQTIDGKDLLMENIFITHSRLQLGFTCINPELFYVGSNKYNCTHNTIWIAKDTVEAIFTSRGILSSHHYLHFQVESKIRFMDNQVFQLIEDSSDLDHYPPTNATTFEIIMNDFHALPVHSKGWSISRHWFWVCAILVFNLLLCQVV